jgi:hypothetical protein
MDYRLSTCLTDVLTKKAVTVCGFRQPASYKFIEIPDLTEHFSLIGACKSLVEYFKRSNLQAEIKTMLKQENATRWNSLLRCLESILAVFPELVQVLTVRKKLAKVNCIDEILLTALVEFLEVFQRATLDLEVFKKPTLHKVAFWRYNLLKHLKHVTSDVIKDGKVTCRADLPEIIALKSVLKPVVDEKFKLRELHVAATHLDPVLKNNMEPLGISDEMVKTANATLFECMQNVRDGKLQGDGLDKDDNIVSQLPPRKKHRPGTSQQSMYVEFQRVGDGDNSRVQQGSSNEPNLASRKLIAIQDEFDAYSNYWLADDEQELIENLMGADVTLADSEGSHFSILAWWKHFGQVRFPVLARVARTVLCIPAASAKSENNFSDASNTVTDKRNLLKPRTINDTLFYRSNRELCS